MMLHELKPAEGASKTAKRKGRGAVWATARRPVTATRARKRVPAPKSQF